LPLNGWFYPAAGLKPSDGCVFLFLHGNGGNISHRLPRVETLLETGASVFLIDFRGYGRSAGRPGEKGTYLDAQAACRWLRQKGFAAEKIIALGESLGGGIASELAVREKLGGLILQSSFTSLPDIGAELFPWLPVRWLASIRYDTVSKLPDIHCPVLIMHSREDDLIGFHHAEKNFAAAHEPKMLKIISGDHNDQTGNAPSFSRRSKNSRPDGQGNHQKTMMKRTALSAMEPFRGAAIRG